MSRDMRMTTCAPTIIGSSMRSRWPWPARPIGPLTTWEKGAPKVTASLREASDELLTFYRFPPSQWKALRTTNAIERLHGQFH